MVKRKKSVKRGPVAKRRAARKKVVRRKVSCRRTSKKTARKKSAAKPAAAKSADLGLEKIGEVTHYFPHVKAAAVMVLKDGLKAGDKIYIKGHTTDFKETIISMQLDHVTIDVARKGQEIGLLVKSRVRIGDSVYRL